MKTFTVPYAALGHEASWVKEEMSRAFDSVIDGGHYVLGPEVASFEREFAAYCQTRYAVGVSNGTSALLLTLKALGLKEGDEVITAPNSFIASASSIALAGGRPVFADIRPDGNIDPQQIEAAITPRTRALMPVHLTGRLARMPEILTIAKRHRLMVLEDSAQAVGAKLDGKAAGSWGDAAGFSLHPLKNLRVFGDGGMVTTQNEEVAERIKISRSHGLVTRERCDGWSLNARLDELQAALASIQLRHLNEWTEKRRILAFRYNRLLKPYVQVPEEGIGEYHVYQTYVVQAERRDQLLTFLRENGVEALIHYATPIHLQPAARSLGYSAGDFPNTMRYVGRILSLPLYPSMTQGQQDHVVELIADFYKSE